MCCIDHLVLALCDLAQQAFTAPGREDQDNRIRIIDTPPSFRRILDLAFNQINGLKIRNFSDLIILLKATEYGICDFCCY
jgi:uncharacterized membrane protein